MSSLENKVAIVTGAAQGMGLATAQELATRGAICVLVDNNTEKIVAALESVKQIDERATSYVIDVSQRDQWYRWSRI